MPLITKPQWRISNVSIVSIMLYRCSCMCNIHSTDGLGVYRRSLKRTTTDIEKEKKRQRSRQQRVGPCLLLLCVAVDTLCQSKVEPPNKGQVGTWTFVQYLEVVLYWGVVSFYITVTYYPVWDKLYSTCSFMLIFHVQNAFLYALGHVRP